MTTTSRWQLIEMDFSSPDLAGAYAIGETISIGGLDFLVGSEVATFDSGGVTGSNAAATVLTADHGIPTGSRVVLAFDHDRQVVSSTALAGFSDSVFSTASRGLYAEFRNDRFRIRREGNVAPVDTRYTLVPGFGRYCQATLATRLGSRAAEARGYTGSSSFPTPSSGADNMHLGWGPGRATDYTADLEKLEFLVGTAANRLVRAWLWWLPPPE